MTPEEIYLRDIRHQVERMRSEVGQELRGIREVLERLGAFPAVVYTDQGDGTLVDE